MSADPMRRILFRTCPTCGAQGDDPQCYRRDGSIHDGHHVDRTLPPETGQLRAVPAASARTEEEIRADEREKTARRIEAWAWTLHSPAAQSTAVHAADVARDGR